MRTRPRFGRLPLVSGLIALSLATVGLIGPVAAATPTTATASTPSTAVSGSLVGTWERVTTCKELVHALEKADLDQFVLDNVVGNGFLPGVTSPDQIADPKHPCKGAVPRCMRTSSRPTASSVLWTLRANRSMPASTRSSNRALW
jgi:hypothetical protein